MRALSGCRWHLDEVFVKINGERHYLWRAVDQEGEVLEAFVSKKRDRKAALKFLRELMKRYPRPDAIITDRLRSYRAALRELGGSGRHQAGRWLNNRAENSHLPFRRREHAMLRFRRMRSLQKFATVHSVVYNHFNLRRSLCSRDNSKINRAAALAKWRQLWASKSLLTVENSDLLISSDSARNGLEVRTQAAQQPDHLQVAVGLRLQPTAGPHPVQIPVDVQLQQVGGIVPRAPCLFRLRAFEPGPSQVETVDESVDEPHWVVGIHLVVYRVRQ